MLKPVAHVTWDNFQKCPSLEFTLNEQELHSFPCIITMPECLYSSTLFNFINSGELQFHSI